MRAMRYLEDLRPGETIALGSLVVDRDELIEFGRRYDPQPFHVDEAAGAASPFGGVIASGWHTGAMFQRLLVDGIVGEFANLGGQGFDDVRFLHPVRPGDVLRASVEIADVRRSERKPDRGTVTLRGALHDTRGTQVFAMTLRVRVAARAQPR